MSAKKCENNGHKTPGIARAVARKSDDARQGFQLFLTSSRMMSIGLMKFLYFRFGIVWFHQIRHKRSTVSLPKFSLFVVEPTTFLNFYSN